MALDEQFLADLEDLSGDDSADDLLGMDAGGKAAEAGGVVEASQQFSVHQVARMSSSDRYQNLLSQIRAETARQSAADANSAPFGGGNLNDPLYHLLVECNKLTVDMDNEMAVIHNYIRDRYRKKFPELESLVPHPYDYARVVDAIGNEEDVAGVDLSHILPSATIMVVSVTAATTTWVPLTEAELAHVHEACKLMVKVDEDKKEVLAFLESQMHRIAPNLSLALGSEIAAKLMGLAGGLIELSNMPSCNIQVLGQKRKLQTGGSSGSTERHQGLLWQCDILQKTPPALRLKAVRLIAGKCTLLARIDAHGSDREGRRGQEFLEEMHAKIEKWQEVPPAKKDKPLPVPDAQPKKKRGGRRLRSQKERFGVTEVQKAASRTGFNQAEEEYIDGDEVIGLGQLGKGSGKLRLAPSRQRTKLNKQQQKKLHQATQLRSQGPGAVSGLASSLAFTPVQGIELINPERGSGGSYFGGGDTRDGTQSYFSELSGFKSIRG